MSAQQSTVVQSLFRGKPEKTKYKAPFSLGYWNGPFDDTALLPSPPQSPLPLPSSLSFDREGQSAVEKCTLVPIRGKPGIVVRAAVTETSYHICTSVTLSTSHICLGFTSSTGSSKRKGVKMNLFIHRNRQMNRDPASCYLWELKPIVILFN